MLIFSSIIGALSVKGNMPLVFQGLVLGATLMYGYVYHSATFLARFGYRRGSPFRTPWMIHG